MSWSVTIARVAGSEIRIHITFLLSAMAIAYTDKLMSSVAASKH